MRERLMRVASRVLALLLGMVWGFFVAFNVVFSDIFGVLEMAWAVGFVFIAYALLGLPFGALGRATSWRWAWWLASMGVLFVMLSLFDNLARTVYMTAVILAVVGGSALGALLGSSLAEAVSKYAARRHGGNGSLV